MKPDRVKFCRWTDSPHTPIAILPDVPANPGRVMMYEHFGQHGEGVYPHSQMRAASVRDPDVRALKRELQQIGYKLRVVRRIARKSINHQ